MRQPDQGAKQPEHGVEHAKRQCQAERHYRRGSFEAEIADLGGDPAGQTSQPPGDDKHHRRGQQHEQDAPHQSDAAHAASAVLASSNARACASHVAMACPAAPCKVATSVTADDSTGIERRPGASQYSSGRIADQHVIALPHGDQILRLSPQARQQRLVRIDRMRGPQGLARGLRKRQPQRRLSGRVGVGEFPRERGRRARQVPGSRPVSRAALADCTNAMRRAALSFATIRACIDASAFSSAVIRTANWLSADCLASIAAIRVSSGARLGACRCSSADTRVCSGPRSGAAGAGAAPAATGRRSRAATRAASGSRSGAVAADAAPGGPPWLPAH